MLSHLKSKIQQFPPLTHVFPCLPHTRLSLSLISYVVCVFLFIVGAGGTGSIGSRLKNLFVEAGFKKLFLNGLGPRCVMIGTLTAGQFAIYDSVMELTGASKFNFIDPDA